MTAIPILGSSNLKPPSEINELRVLLVVSAPDNDGLEIKGAHLLAELICCIALDTNQEIGKPVVSDVREGDFAYCLKDSNGGLI